MAEFALESSAFENAQPIPSRDSCEGEDVSPPFRWTNVPKRAGRWRSSSTTRMPRAVSSLTGSPGGNS